MFSINLLIEALPPLSTLDKPATVYEAQCTPHAPLSTSVRRIIREVSSKVSSSPAHVGSSRLTLCHTANGSFATPAEVALRKPALYLATAISSRSWGVSDEATRFCQYYFIFRRCKECDYIWSRSVRKNRATVVTLVSTSCPQQATDLTAAVVPRVHVFRRPPREKSRILCLLQRDSALRWS